MIDQNNQSPEAAQQCVCHTEQECNQMYLELSPDLKSPALTMLKQELAPVFNEILSAYKSDPEHWAAPYHLFWGMSVRNLLRNKGFGEKYFSVHNLDDIYISLVEEALNLREQ